MGEEFFGNTAPEGKSIKVTKDKYGNYRKELIDKKTPTSQPAPTMKERVEYAKHGFWFPSSGKKDVVVSKGSKGNTIITEYEEKSLSQPIIPGGGAPQKQVIQVSEATVTPIPTEQTFTDKLKSSITSAKNRVIPQERSLSYSTQGNLNQEQQFLKQVQQEGGTVTYDNRGSVTSILVPDNIRKVHRADGSIDTVEYITTTNPDNTRTITRDIRSDRDTATSTLTKPTEPTSLFDKIGHYGGELTTEGKYRTREFQRDPSILNLGSAIVTSGSGALLEHTHAIGVGAKNTGEYIVKHPIESAIVGGMILLPEALSTGAGLVKAGKIAKYGTRVYFGYEGVKYGLDAQKDIKQSLHPSITLGEKIGEVGAAAVIFGTLEKSPKIIKDLKVSRTATSKYKNQLVIKETNLPDIVDLAPSTKIKIKPLEGHNIEYLKKADIKGEYTEGAVQPIFSKSKWVDTKTLSNIPTEFNMKFNSQKASILAEASGKPTTFPGKPAQFMSLTESGKTVISAKHIELYDRPTLISRLSASNTKGKYIEAGRLESRYFEPPTAPRDFGFKYSQSNQKAYDLNIEFKPQKKIEMEILLGKYKQYPFLIKTYFKHPSEITRTEQILDTKTINDYSYMNKPLVIEKIKTSTKKKGKIYTFNDIINKVSEPIGATQILKGTSPTVTIQKVKVETATKQKFKQEYSQEFSSLTKTETAQSYKHISEPGIILKQNYKTSQVHKTQQKQQSSQVSRQAFKPFVKLQPIIMADTKNIQRSTQINKSISTESFKPVTTTKTYTDSFSKNLIERPLTIIKNIDLKDTQSNHKPSIGGVPMIKIPHFNKRRFQNFDSGILSPKQTTAYTPTLTAVALNVKAKKKSKIGIITGLGIRPIIKGGYEI